MSGHILTPCLGVVGFSTRALAQAAVDLGLRVTAIDAFCDSDTQELATCYAIKNWPDGIADLTRQTSCDGWVLAGGMENHRRLLIDLNAAAKVFGPTRGQLALLRSQSIKRRLAAAVPKLGLPKVATKAHWLPPGRIFKPFRSSGGLRVFQDEDVLDTVQKGEISKRGYWQHFIVGKSLGITCCIADEQIFLCGATESLDKAQWPAPLPFVYRGSIGPYPLSQEQQSVVLEMAGWIGNELKYRGWIQADFIEDDAGKLWLLEINPRWTAGMEILHHCVGISPLASHLTACHSPWSFREHRPKCSSMAKAIFYATNPGELDRNKCESLAKFRARQSLDNNSWWDIADVPAAIEMRRIPFAPGQPLFTIRIGQNTKNWQWKQTRQFLTNGLNEARRRLLATCGWLL